jgi:hypothetical protein
LSRAGLDPAGLYHLGRYALRAGVPPFARWPAVRGLEARELRLLATRWYHDFSELGFRTPQKHGAYRRNQETKQPVLFAMIDRALEICRARPGPIRVLELFCADGFYAHRALQGGATEALGVDLSRRPLEQARLAARLLGLERAARFERCDVFDVKGEFELGICAGGLYHLEDPAALLRKLRAQVHHSLVVQTVYSLARSDADYFETPAPGWTWGCRFSRERFLGLLRESGWRALEVAANELAGNSRLEDRGSIYALCAPL